MDRDEIKSPVLLKAEGLGYQVDGQVLLSDINFEISTGERVAIFGPSGAGKSTLIRLLNRLDEPGSGTVYLDGQDYKEIPPRVLRRRLGMVMQQPNLFPGSVADNLRFGPTAQGESLDEARIKALLSGVDLKGFADRDVAKLSGGEAQRVNLARTLANKPEVLLLDEPTSSLDQAARREVEETILSVLDSGEVTCILVSHDRAQVQRVADRVLVLEGGKLIADSPVEEVLDAQSMD
ncbi:MAG: phosphate ABC transporter ATP-binding protein [Brevefilum sp.]|nr:phosphate ABC transporter ATP-binding protein [Brevefilum sp.]MDT8380956.1 phosphate ABC transporter ATP-binding protein [Brevefilum sp.]MDW7754377.1 phosphate ABC transporter ATP-binding protein [Brevefilum sp.]